MSNHCLTVEQSREVDRRALAECGLHGLVLMENAGRNAAELLAGLAPSGRYVIVCGPGNNGGDGAVMARHLHNRGYDVTICATRSPGEMSPDARVNMAVCQWAGIRVHTLGVDSSLEDWKGLFAKAEWLVDALFGTGFRGPVRPPLDAVIRAMNDSGRSIFAVDAPSGLDCDTGTPSEPCVRAAATATFVATKPGLTAASAREFVGRVEVIDIGVPRRLVEEIARTRLPAGKRLSADDRDGD